MKNHHQQKIFKVENPRSVVNFVHHVLHLNARKHWSWTLAIEQWVLDIGDWWLDIGHWFKFWRENLNIGGVLTSPPHGTLEITGGYHSTLVPVKIVERLLVGDLLILPVFLALLVSVICEIILSSGSEGLFFLAFSGDRVFYLTGVDLDLGLVHHLANLVHVWKVWHRVKIFWLTCCL